MLIRLPSIVPVQRTFSLHSTKSFTFQVAADGESYALVKYVKEGATVLHMNVVIHHWQH